MENITKNVFERLAKLAGRPVKPVHYVQNLDSKYQPWIIFVHGKPFIDRKNSFAGEVEEKSKYLPVELPVH